MTNRNKSCNKDMAKVSTSESGYPLDETDRELINLLMNNGRTSNIELASALNVSEATVRRRIDHLLEKGIIRGFSALLDNKKLGNTLKASIHLKVSSKALSKVASHLVESNYSCTVYRVIGKYNLYSEMLFRDIHDFQHYLDELSEDEAIEDIEYHIVTHSFKPCPWSGI